MKQTDTQAFSSNWLRPSRKICLSTPTSSCLRCFCMSATAVTFKASKCSRPENYLTQDNMIDPCHEASLATAAEPGRPFFVPLSLIQLCAKRHVLHAQVAQRAMLNCMNSCNYITREWARTALDMVPCASHAITSAHPSHWTAE